MLFLFVAPCFGERMFKCLLPSILKASPLVVIDDANIHSVQNRFKKMG